MVLLAAHRGEALAGLAAAQMGAAGEAATAPRAGHLAGWASLAGAATLAAFDLLHDRLPGPVQSAARRVTRPVAAGLDYLHSGAVGDYVAWLVVGLALLTAGFALA